jgi:hypothetical protein
VLNPSGLDIPNWFPIDTVLGVLLGGIHLHLSMTPNKIANAVDSR